MYEAARVRLRLRPVSRLELDEWAQGNGNIP